MSLVDQNRNKYNLYKKYCKVELILSKIFFMIVEFKLSIFVLLKYVRHLTIVR